MARRGSTGERLIGLFLLGLLLTPPLIGTFDRAVLIRGIPVLYLYLFLCWALLIALTALVVERPNSDEEIAEGEARADPIRSPVGRRTLSHAGRLRHCHGLPAVPLDPIRDRLLR